MTQRCESADEIRRIVAVAEALAVDPNTARNALRGEAGRIPTDAPIDRAIKTARGRLHVGTARRGAT